MFAELRAFRGNYYTCTKPHVSNDLKFSIIERVLPETANEILALAKRIQERSTAVLKAPIWKEPVKKTRLPQTSLLYPAHGSPLFYRSTMAKRSFTSRATPSTDPTGPSTPAGVPSSTTTTPPTPVTSLADAPDLNSAPSLASWDSATPSPSCLSQGADPQCPLSQSTLSTLPCPAPARPVVTPDDTPASVTSAVASPVCNSPAANSPAPAKGHDPAVVLTVNVGLDDTACWSQTAPTHMEVSVGEVWASCVAFLNIEQTCCSSAMCNGQSVTSADQTLAAFGSGSNNHLDFGLNNEGSHFVRLTMVDETKASLTAKVVKFEQVGAGLQRWANACNLPFDQLQFLREGCPLDLAASCQNLGLADGDTVEVMSTAASAPSSSSSISGLQVRRLTAAIHVERCKHKCMQSLYSEAAHMCDVF